MNQTIEKMPEGHSEDMPIRPIFILSPNEAKEYQLFINNTLLGLAERSVHAAVIAQRQTLKKVEIKYASEQIIHPKIELPLTGRKNFDLLRKKLETIDPTVVHCFGQSKTALAKRIAKEFSIPFIVSFYSTPKRHNITSLRSKLLNSIILPSEAIYQKSIKTLFRYVDKIKIVKPGIFAKQGISSFNRDAKLTNIAVDGGSATDDISTLTPIFEAIKHLFIDGYEFFIVIIDSAGAERKIRHTIEELGISQLCTFLPKLKSCKAILNETDIFITADSSKSFNSVLLEVMSNGIAVITAKDSFDDLIENEKNALIFEPEDQLSIYAPLQRLLDNQSLAREMAETGRKLVSELHTVSGMVDSTIKTYKDAMTSARSSLSDP